MPTFLEIQQDIALFQSTHIEVTEFACQLGVDLSELTTFVSNHLLNISDSSSSLAVPINYLLESATVPEWEQAAAYRILLELIVAIDAVELLDLDELASFRSELCKINAKMARLSTLDSLSSETFLQFWHCDSEFHKFLFRSSSLKNLTSLVDDITEAFLEVGRPRSILHLRDTVDEHRRIIEALTIKPLCVASVFIALRDHIQRALQRWLRMESAYPRKLDDYPSDLQAIFCELLADEDASNAALAVARLQIQHDFENKLVIYQDGAFFEDEKLVQKRIVLDSYPISGIDSAVAAYQAIIEEKTAFLQFQPQLQD